jgi:hypothetical protein
MIALGRSERSEIAENDPRNRIGKFQVSIIWPRIAQSSGKTGQMKGEITHSLMMSSVCGPLDQPRRYGPGRELFDPPINCAGR